MKQILVAVGEKKALRDIFGVSQPTVRDALKGTRVSHLGLRIRREAINRGGVEI
jgi:DNA-binding FadR family transcriptional regulator